MTTKNTADEFGSVSKWLHWLIALGIFALIYLGLEQAGMERGPEKQEVRALHSSIALVVLLLMTARLIWRWMNEVPAHPEGMPAWQRLSATLVHWGLYVAVFVQLLSGPMTTATGGNPVPFFGLFSILLPVAKDEEMHHFYEGIHESAWIFVAVLLAIHILGSLYNHFVLKNDVLRRMTAGVK